MLPSLHLCPIGSPLKELPTDVKGKVLEILMRMENPCDLEALMVLDKSGQMFDDEVIVGALLAALQNMGLSLDPGEVDDREGLAALCKGVQAIHAFFRKGGIWQGEPTARFLAMLKAKTNLNMENVMDYIILQFPRDVLDSPQGEFLSCKTRFMEDFDRARKLRVIYEYPSALRFLGHRDRGEWDVVIEAVTRNGATLEYASGELRENEELVKIAVARTGSALQFVGYAFRNRMEVVRVAVERDPTALKYDGSGIDRTTDEWRNLVLSAVKRYGLALQWAGRHLRDDFEVVNAAVYENDGALNWASARLRKDERVLASARASRKWDMDTDEDW